MAARNSLKVYSENGVYHLYNRGVEKRDIFLDEQDFSVFCSYLKTYLLPKDLSLLRQILASKESTPAEKNRAFKLLSLKNFTGRIELLAYALLPNHFHFLIKQAACDEIDKFMNALGVRYGCYFNRRYHRIGPLFQGRYKGVLVQSDEQLLHLSRYIHLNPLKVLGLPLTDWRKITWPFSLPEYFDQRKTDWVRPKFVLEYFCKENPHNTYESFMRENMEAEIIAPAAIDSDAEL